MEQLLTFANVTASIRCHVLQLESGGLWVHSPQWPTGEFCQLLDDLGTPVEHVVLPCNALEHKAPMRAFLDRYPQASVWISPGQYGPFGTCGQTINEPINMGYRVDGILGDPTSSPPFCLLQAQQQQNASSLQQQQPWHCRRRRIPRDIAAKHSLAH
jgi:hypothetical protein